MTNLRNYIRHNSDSSTNILENNNQAFRRIISPGSRQPQAQSKHKDYKVGNEVKERLHMLKLGYKPEDYNSINSIETMIEKSNF